MNKVIACAPGKSILFGEHAVVHGYPAIALAISLVSSCEIEQIPEKRVELCLKNSNKFYKQDNAEKLIEELPKKYKQISTCLRLFQQNYELIFENTKITIASQLFKSAGLGSSASIAVALVEAINAFHELNLTKSEVSDIAYEMEKVVHGTPSGIDNTICTFGNVIHYQNKEFVFIPLSKEVKLLITFTNASHDTKRAIEKVRKFKMTHLEKCEEIFTQIGEIALEGKQRLKEGDLQSLGELMNENQELLEQLGVSNKIISKINEIALKNGAFGSKLTGAGLGGCVISVGEDDTLYYLEKLLKGKGFPCFVANSDNVGVRSVKKE
ncbi:MAG: mevalonate kinase [Promethearchaeota archaeon]